MFRTYKVRKGVISSGVELEECDFMFVSSGGIANDTTVNKLATLCVSKGGTANDTTVKDTGLFEVLKEGTANNTTVNPGGIFRISSGGTATAIKENGGYVEFDEDADVTFMENTFTNIKLDSWESATVHSGTTACNTTLKSGGKLYVYAGGIANNTEIETGGSLNISSGGIANNTEIETGGSLNVSSGGTANNTTINASSYFNLDGGTANDTVVNKGSFHISHGGTANNTTLNSGTWFIVEKEATANSTTVNYGAQLYISSGGTATEIKENGGFVDVEKGTDVTFVKNIFSGLVLKSGRIATVHAGTTACSTTIDNGKLQIHSGGTATCTTLDDFGSLRISRGGVHRGTLDIDSVDFVHVDKGATIDFTVADRTEKDDYLINDLSKIAGDPTYTITVSENQETGTYKLAQNAFYFSDPISIGTDADSFGSITVNGDALDFNGVTYELDNVNGDLTLTITGKAVTVQPDTRTNLLSNKVSQIVAWDASQGKVGYVAANGQESPAWCGIWEWGGTIDLGNGNKVAEKDLWRVTGVGHFKGSNVDYDGVLLYNGIGNTFAAWTDLKNPSYGYVDLCHVEGNFQTQCLTDLDGDEYDDVLIYDEKGSFGVVSGAAEWHSIWDAPANNVQKLIGAGNFGASDGLDSLLVKKTDENAYFLWHNNDSTFKTWDWSQTYIGSLTNEWTVAGIGDFKADSIDDIVMWNTSNGEMWMWNDGKADKQHWIGTISNADWEVAAVGDYNGDGKEDLLLRELKSGWGGVGYWASGEATGWTDLNARIETNMESKFAVIA